MPLATPTVTSPNATQSIPAFIVPILKEYAMTMREPISFLMVGTVFGAMLVPLLIALFTFSTPQARRKPLFIIATLQVLLGLAICAWNGYSMIHVILSPLDPPPLASSGAFTLTVAVAPWIIDLALIIRLLAVYPRASNSRSTLLAVFALPVIIKVGRVVALVLFGIQWSRSFNDDEMNGDIGIMQSQAFAHSPAIKVEWVAQMIDNGYVTAMFLWKLRGTFGRGNARQSVASEANVCAAGRIRTLFWIATTNFVFPVIFNIAQLFTIFLCSFFVSARIAIINIYISIIGAVFCCVWSSRSSRPRGRSVTLRSGADTHTARSARSDTGCGTRKGEVDFPVRVVDSQMSRNTEVRVHIQKTAEYL